MIIFKINMGELIINTDIPREKGHIYYVSTDEKGNLCVYKSKAGRKKKEKTTLI